MTKLEDFLELAKNHRRVIISQKILGDQITPVQAYQALANQLKGSILLESDPGRYSFIGFNPDAELMIKQNRIIIKDRAGDRQIAGNIIEIIREFYRDNHAAGKIPGFAGGLAGFFSFDAAKLIEEKLQTDRSDKTIPDILLKSYRDHIIFDHKTHTVTFATVTECKQENLIHCYQEAIILLQNIQVQIKQFPIESAADEKKAFPESAQTSDRAFIEAGKIAKAHIHAGDAFQVVLSRTFEKEYTCPPFDIYRSLRSRNPSPYLFYLENEEYILCGASPEKMLSLNDTLLESNPLAGTRPRGVGIDDKMQAEHLLADPKEVAEHMMLVDLARNDLGAVAEPGTVRVSALKQIKMFSRVMHISSTVNATIKDDKDALDAFFAAFPAGTLSGAPKIRAIEIIECLETRSRGAYGGAIGFLDNQGNFDSCIAIRLALLKNGKAFVTAGAGITAGSDLQKEADETRHKARAVLEAIDFAQGGLS